MWRGSLGRIQRARLDARKAGDKGDFISAHSVMLSAYISAQHEHPIWYALLTLWHGAILYRQWLRLNHNQLDVLVQFLLKVRTKTGLDLWPIRLISMATREAQLARRAQESKEAKPHQMALACMTLAEVYCAVDFNYKNIILCIDQALGFESKIKREKDQPQGLRQLVRILRKVGELYIHPRMRDLNKARFYLRRARALAEGEAKTPDQAGKILAILQEITPID